MERWGARGVDEDGNEVRPDTGLTLVKHTGHTGQTLVKTGQIEDGNEVRPAGPLQIWSNTGQITVKWVETVENLIKRWTATGPFAPDQTLVKHWSITDKYRSNAGQTPVKYWSSRGR